MDSNSSNKLLPIGAAARYLGISEATLRRWDRDGSFKATYVSSGKHRYYSIADLEKKTKGLYRLAYDWAGAQEAFLPQPDFYCATGDRFKARHERMDEALKAPLISSAAGEIGNNSFDHNLGNWPDVMGIFFAYDSGKRKIVLADRGVGILATLRRVRPDLKTHQEALRVAFTELVTGRAPEHRGNGLKYVKDAIMEAGAALTFTSGDAALEIRKGETELRIKKTDAPIRGCLALIEF